MKRWLLDEGREKAGRNFLGGAGLVEDPDADEAEAEGRALPAWPDRDSDEVEEEGAEPEEEEEWEEEWL